MKKQKKNVVKMLSAGLTAALVSAGVLPVFAETEVSAETPDRIVAYLDKSEGNDQNKGDSSREALRSLEAVRRYFLGKSEAAAESPAEESSETQYLLVLCEDTELTETEKKELEKYKLPFMTLEEFTGQREEETETPAVPTPTISPVPTPTAAPTPAPAVSPTPAPTEEPEKEEDPEEEVTPTPTPTEEPEKEEDPEEEVTPTPTPTEEPEKEEDPEEEVTPTPAPTEEPEKEDPKEEVTPTPTPTEKPEKEEEPEEVVTSTPAPAEKPEKEEKPEAAGSEAPVSGETKTEGLKEEAETTPAPAAKAKTREKQPETPTPAPTAAETPVPVETAEPVPAAEEEPTAAGENAGLWTAVLQVRSLPGVDLVGGGSQILGGSEETPESSGTAPEESYPDSGNSSAQTVVTNGSVTPLRPAEAVPTGDLNYLLPYSLSAAAALLGGSVLLRLQVEKKRNLFRAAVQREREQFRKDCKIE